MKKILLLCALMAAATSMLSCGDLVEGSGNGKLDGFWQLTRIDTLATGGHADMAADRKFLSVQGTILTLHDADEGPRYMFRFSHANGQLALSDARYNDRERGDTLVASTAELHPFGLDTLSDTLTVEQLTGSRLVLRGLTLRLSFRKF